MNHNWILGPGHWLLIWLNFCQFNVPVEYHILPAYYPNEEEKENPELFAENVRKLMADYLKIPLSDLSYEDAHLISKMVQYKLPKKCALIRVHHVKKKFKSEHLFLDFIYIWEILIYLKYFIIESTQRILKVRCLYLFPWLVNHLVCAMLKALPIIYVLKRLNQSICFSNKSILYSSFYYLIYNFNYYWLLFI